jgi:putative endonuclease
MYCAYVIQSLTDPTYFYKGHTHDLQKRLLDHNSLKTRSNKHYAPFKIVHAETFDNRESAIACEKYWKTAAGRRYLHRIINQVS